MKDKQLPRRLSELLIRELCDGDHNCPFRQATPIHIAMMWGSLIDKPIKKDKV